jgi:hypothetical protein
MGNPDRVELDFEQNAKARTSRKENPEVDQLVSDAGVVGRIRWWITAIAIGSFPSFYLAYGADSDTILLVEFDLDIGPVVAGVCPNIQFSDSIWENMYVTVTYPTSPH